MWKIIRLDEVQEENGDILFNGTQQTMGTKNGTDFEQFGDFIGKRWKVKRAFLKKSYRKYFIIIRKFL